MPERLLDVSSLALDSSGNVYVTGRAFAGSLPTSPDVFQPDARSGLDGFVAKFDRSGRLLWATYLGGSSGSGISTHKTPPGDSPLDIAVDSSGFVYVAGVTSSPDFPTLNAVQTAPTTVHPASGSAFISKLDPNGRRLVYSTLFGGVQDASASRAIAVDGMGEAYVAGHTNAADYQSDFMFGMQGTPRTFFAKFGAGGRLLYTASIDRARTADVTDAAVDADGALHVVTSRPLAIKLNPRGDQLLYAQTFAEAPGAQARAISIDPGGRAVVVGTAAGGFPVTFGSPSLGGIDTFVARLSHEGAVEFATVMGGSSDESAPLTIGVDLSGAVHVGGSTRSLDLPVSSAMLDGHPDASVLRSDDGGASWRRTTNQEITVEQLVVGRQNPELLYGRGSTFYRSIDGGRSWISPALEYRFDHIAVSPFSDTTLYATGIRNPRPPARFEAGLFRSEDGGTTWTLIDSTTAGVDGDSPRVVAVSRFDPLTVYVGTGGNGLRISSDGGRTWEDRADGLPAGFTRRIATIEAVVADPRRPGTVYVVVNKSIHRSTDDGRTWTTLTQTYSNGFTSLEVGEDGTTLYAASYDGLLSSIDGGTTWRLAPGSRFVFAPSIAIDPTRAAVAFVADRLGGPLLRTSDGGVSWPSLSLGQLAQHGVSAVAVTPARPRTVYLAGRIDRVPFLFRLERTSTPPTPPAIEVGSYLPLGGVLAAATGPAGEVALVTIGPDGRSRILTLMDARR